MKQQREGMLANPLAVDPALLAQTAWSFVENLLLQV